MFWKTILKQTNIKNQEFSGYSMRVRVLFLLGAIEWFGRKLLKDVDHLVESSEYIEHFEVMTEVYNCHIWCNCVIISFFIHLLRLNSHVFLNTTCMTFVAVFGISFFAWSLQKKLQTRVNLFQHSVNYCYFHPKARWVSTSSLFLFA